MPLARHRPTSSDNHQAAAENQTFAPVRRIDSDTATPATATPKVRIFAELGSAAFKPHRDSLAVWVIARAFSQEAVSGSSVVCLDDFMAFALSQGAFGELELLRLMAPAEQLGLIRRVRNNSKIHIAGILDAAKIFGLDRFSPGIIVPLELFRGRAKRRACMYVALVTSATSGPISRAIIAKISGIGKTTQRRYEDRVEIEVIRNQEIRAGGRSVRRNYASDDFSVVPGTDLANTYETGAERGSPSYLRKRFGLRAFVTGRGQPHPNVRSYFDRKHPPNDREGFVLDHVDQVSGGKSWSAVRSEPIGTPSGEGRVEERRPNSQHSVSRNSVHRDRNS